LLTPKPRTWIVDSRGFCLFDEPTPQDVVDLMHDDEAESERGFSVCRGDGGRVQVLTKLEGGTDLVRIPPGRAGALETAAGEVTREIAIECLVAFLANDDSRLDAIEWRSLPEFIPEAPDRMNGQFAVQRHTGQYELVEEAERLGDLRKVMRVELVLVILAVGLGLVFILGTWWDLSRGNKVPSISEVCLILGTIYVPIFLIHKLNWRCPICRESLGIWPGRRCDCSSLQNLREVNGVKTSESEGLRQRSTGN
jgi:hypothetical protein